MIIDANTVIAATGVVTAIGGVFVAIQGISSHFKKKKAAERQAVIDHVKADMELVKQALEAKICRVENELELQKQSVSKDLSSMKEAYNSEIKVLGQQIQELRSDLNAQHASLVSLLTKLVDVR